MRFKSIETIETIGTIVKNRGKRSFDSKSYVNSCDLGSNALI
jgi:hypothetical protein